MTCIDKTRVWSMSCGECKFASIWQTTRIECGSAVQMEGSIIFFKEGRESSLHSHLSTDMKFSLHLYSCGSGTVLIVCNLIPPQFHSRQKNANFRQESYKNLSVNNYGKLFRVSSPWSTLIYPLAAFTFSEISCWKCQLRYDTLNNMNALDEF